MMTHYWFVHWRKKSGAGVGVRSRVVDVGREGRGGERKHHGVDLLEFCMPESWLYWHQTKYFQPPLTPPPALSLFTPMSVSKPVQLPPPHHHPSLSLSLPQPMKQESHQLRFLRQDHRSLCPDLRTNGIPSPCCCCCCCPAVAPDIQNRSLTSAWLLEYGKVPRIQRNTEARQKVDSFVHMETKVHSNTEIGSRGSNQRDRVASSGSHVRRAN